MELPPLQKLSIQGQGYGEASRRHSLAHDSSAGAGPSPPEAAQQGPLGQGLLYRAGDSESADKESHVYLHGSGAANVEMRQTSGKNCSPPRAPCNRVLLMSSLRNPAHLSCSSTLHKACLRNGSCPYLSSQ